MRLPSHRESPIMRMGWVILGVAVLDAIAPLTPRPVLWASLVPALVPILGAVFVLPLVLRRSRGR